LGGDAVHANLLERVEPRVDEVDAEDRGRARGEALDPLDGLVAGTHGELVALAEPALDRGAEAWLQVAPHVEEGRRPGARVEVLVRAADCQCRRRQVDLDGARGMAEVPDDQRVRGGGDGRQVEELAGT